MNPPTMAGWNLGLRLCLELAALAGIGLAAWKLPPGSVRWAAVILAPVAAAAIWGTFNVLNDPSRSGNAPIEVNGWTRLAIEVAILGAGAVAMWFAGQQNIGIAYSALIVLHYATSTSRIDWLVHA